MYELLSYLCVPVIPFYFSPIPALTSGNHYFSVSMSLFVVCVDSTYKWNYVEFVFPWLILLSIIPSGSTHVLVNGKISCSIVLVCVHIYVFSASYTHTHMHTYTNHSSIFGHRLLLYLGYCEWCSEYRGTSLFSNSTFLDRYPKVELLDDMIVILVAFQEVLILFSTVAASVCSLTGSAWGSWFVHEFTSTCSASSFWW